MKDINQEIEAMAENLEKASTTPIERATEVIKSLGKDGLKAKLAILSDDEKVVLKSVLEKMTENKEGKMKKAVDMDKEAQGAKVIQGKLDDTILQEEIANDDADEKLVKPENKEINHQGDQASYGSKGEVIKGGFMQEKMDNGKAIFPAKDGMHAHEIHRHFEPEDHDAAAEHLEEKASGMMKEKAEGKPADMWMAEEHMKQAAHHKVAKHHKEMEKCQDGVMKSDEGRTLFVESLMKRTNGDKAVVIEKCIQKGMSKDEASKKIMMMEEKEHGTKNPKKLVKDEKEEQKAKREEMKTMKKSVEGDHDKGTILAEEDQLGDTDQMTEEGKDLEDSTQDAAKANKKTQKDVNVTKVEEKMKKSITWEDPNHLFKSSKGGRNFHFSADEYIAKSVEEVTTTPVSKPADTIQKAEKLDLNDLIEKSMDTDWDQIARAKSLEASKGLVTGKLVKSFDEENDLAALLGLTKEEAKKILG